MASVFGSRAKLTVEVAFVLVLLGKVTGKEPFACSPKMYWLIGACDGQARYTVFAVKSFGVSVRVGVELSEDGAAYFLFTLSAKNGFCSDSRSAYMPPKAGF